jgi:probable F420-dependent oxidoreductase
MAFPQPHMKVCINIFGMQRWFPGGLRDAIELVKIADARGVHQLSVSDHLTMGADTSRYPYGAYPSALTVPWYEPAVLLAAMATATSSVRLATSIMIAPLRPLPLLAKQLMTLHHLSQGRLDIGLGAGWQEEEFQASGIPFADRFALLREQLDALQAIWRQAPARFKGRHIQFDGLHTYPQLAPDETIPIWLGLTEKPRNLHVIAAHADGWLPMSKDPGTLRSALAEIHRLMDALGRDPSRLAVRTMPVPVPGQDGMDDLDATLAALPALGEAGVTIVEFVATRFCRGSEDFEGFVDRVAALQD